MHIHMDVKGVGNGVLPLTVWVIRYLAGHQKWPETPDDLPHNLQKTLPVVSPHINITFQSVENVRVFEGHLRPVSYAEAFFLAGTNCIVQLDMKYQYPSEKEKR